MMLSRRRFSLTILAAPACAAAPGARGEILIGVQGWSFRDRNLDDALRATKEAGLDAMELGWNHVEPPRGTPRAQMRNWLLSTPLAEFKRMREKCQAAGVRIVAYSATLRKDFTDEEIAKTFEMASAFGVNTITTSTNVSLAGKLDTYAVRGKMRVGFHNHSVIRPDEFATPSDFAEALRGRSEYLGINLDVGHFVVAGFDPVAFIRENHKRIWSIHLKDRKKEQKGDVPFGQGDTPLREILLLLQKERYGIPAFIEHEIPGGDPVSGVRECVQFCRRVLRSAAL